MKRFFVFLLFVFMSPFIFGEEIFVYKPEDKNISDKQINGISCSAVRLKDNWYLTAAHCVDEKCKDVCVVDLYTENGIFRTTQKNVSWLNSRRTKHSEYDIALINFTNAKIPAASFKEPNIVIVDINKTDTPKILKNTLNIPEAGLTSWNKVFYGPLSKIVFTRDMGVTNGLSGSGVFTNQGDIIAVTSANAERFGDVKFSVFSVFDSNVKSFLSTKIPSLYFKYISLQDFEDIDKLPEEEKNTLISLDRD